jgi:hypothetical protein
MTADPTATLEQITKLREQLVSEIVVQLQEFGYPRLTPAQIETLNAIAQPSALALADIGTRYSHDRRTVRPEKLASAKLEINRQPWDDEPTEPNRPKAKRKSQRPARRARRSNRPRTS